MISTEEYDKAQKIVNQYLDERKIEGFVRCSTGDIIPEYVDCGGCILILEDYEDYQRYYRPAGIWTLTFEVRVGKVYCTGGDVPDLIGKELIPATKEQFKESNARGNRV